MKRIFTLMFAVVTVLTYGCNDSYDDSALWKDIDGIYTSLNELKAQVSTMQEQLTALTAIVGGGAITSITEDSEGHYVIGYKDAESVEHTFTVATMSDANTQPIVGMKLDKEIYYWTTTVKGKTSWLLDTDGAKIPVTGRTPEIDVDAQGYWTLFGTRIKDVAGNPVKAEGKSASVISGIETTGDGTAVITLGDGTKVTAQVRNTFNVTFDVEVKTVITDITTPLVIHYTLVGDAENAILSIEKAEQVQAVVNASAKTITVAFPDPAFESGHIIVMLYDGADNIILKPLHFTTLEGAPTGICSADDLKAFAVAVNNGKSIEKYMIGGEVVLMNDIDMTGVEWADYVIGGVVTPSTTTANTAVKYTMGEHTFNKIFNGKNFALKNVDWTFNIADGNVAHGLFSALGAAGEIKNLTVEGSIRLTGAAPQGCTIGAFAGYAEGKISSCVNKANIAFAGAVASNISVCFGGIAGYALNSSLEDCCNDGALTCGTIANTGNGGNSGFHQGGILGYMNQTELLNCTNNGGVSAPSGRGGGLVAVAASGNITSCVNNGLIQDDVNGVFGGANPDYKRMGGLVGGTSAGVKLLACVNNGNVYSQLGCRTGGFVGHNEGLIEMCENKGVVLSDHTKDGSNYHGSGWAAGYNKTAALISTCVIGGRVGDYTEHKANPALAPAATYGVAVCHGPFDPMTNGLTDEDTEYYAWTVSSEKELSAGVKYYHYSLTNIPQNIFVVEVDLSNPKVMIETVMANEIAPNPNANKNSNNGKNLRETCSETCVRRRAEGRNIVAGINTGFFDSNDGFIRGCHVEYGEPVFINNPTVRASLTNHKPGFTLFGDRSVSFENRTFSGRVKVGATEYEYYSINDTIVRLNKTDGYQANLYTSRFVKNPHPGITNFVGKNALFLVGRNTSSPLKVNDGYFDATITAVVDGRNGASVEVPFVTGKNEWVLQLTGDQATALAGVKAGDAVQIRADFLLGDVAKSVNVHNSSMYRFLYNGKWNKAFSEETAAELMPATCVGASEDGKIVKMVCLDGRTQTDKGMNYWQMYNVMKKLGLHNAIRFDGGGSTTLWKYENGAGAIANRPSDSNGERSCMNYMHVRILE